MNAPLAQPLNGQAFEESDTRTPGERFADHCADRAARVAEGVLSLSEAVDEMHGYAKLSGLVDAIGQDETQAIMSEALAMAETIPDDLSEECEREIMLRAGDLVRQWELADPRDRWRVTGETPQTEIVRNSNISAVSAKAPQYHTPESVVQAFWYVASLNNADYLKRWLAEHPRDVAALQKLWEAKHARP